MLFFAHTFLIPFGDRIKGLMCTSIRCRRQSQYIFAAEFVLHETTHLKHNMELLIKWPIWELCSALWTARISKLQKGMATRVSFSSFLYIFCWRCVHSSALRMCKILSRHKKGRKKKLLLLFVYYIQRQIGKILLMSSIINENRLKQHALFNLPPHRIFELQLSMT